MNRSYDRSYNKPFKESKGGENLSEHVQKNDPVIVYPLEIKVQGNPDRAFKMFKALVQKEKILSLYKQKQSYEKPSDRKRRKKGEAIRKRIEADLRTAQILSGEYDKIQEKKQLIKDQKRQAREEARKASNED